MIRIGFFGQAAEAQEWHQKLTPFLDDFEIVDLVSDAGRNCDVALVWAPPEGALAHLPNLKGIILQGQGVDHMMADASVPRDVPLVRLVDPDMSDALSHWAILNALDFWRDGASYRDQQASKTWASIPQRSHEEAIVGVLGVGAIGSMIARRFAALGFTTRGWARTQKTIENVDVFAGPDALADFADGVNISVCVLPLTPETRGIMNADYFNWLAHGAFVINGGRGPQVNDDELLAALDSGQIGGAALDVFAIEPLPADHPYWAHPKVRVWPHVAAQTNPDSASRQVAAAILAMINGEEPANRVEWTRGY
ncbi:glyoxylate/hydroxypyruvate reductase A [Alphaproteobacteria bacterium]|nr:glyoxylate/hydroxypyruvate reductase A [Alphaproteobacteria bacterium]